MTSHRQPSTTSTILAEVQSGFCEHDGIPGRCPSCRRTAEKPSPATPRPEPPVVADAGDDDDQDPRNTPWWDR